MPEEAKPAEEEPEVSGPEEQPQPEQPQPEQPAEVDATSPGDEAEEESGIHVDEDWKARAAREKEELKRREHKEPETRREDVRDRTMPPADFNSLIASFATQALIQMGQVENPVTGRAEFDSPGARYTIDLLDMLKNKTHGNLEPDEERQLDAILYDLKMRFVRTQQQPPSAASAEPETKPQP